MFERNVRRPWASDDTSLARKVWDDLTPSARALFSTLIDNPGGRFSGKELAELLGKPNPQSISGILSGAETVCTGYGRRFMWVPELQLTGLYLYSMDDVLVGLFAAARLKSPN